MSSPSPRHLLQQAMAAARMGDRSHARMFLSKATELDPEDPLAWLWRAALAEEAEQALIWLNRALDIDPELPQARRALPTVRLQAGIAIARYGDYPTARHLFHSAAEADPDSIVPWLELASLGRSPDEVRKYLDEVLRRDPEHAGALECIDRMDREREAAVNPPTPQSLEVPPAPPVMDERKPNPLDDRLIPVSFEPPPEFAGSTIARPNQYSDPAATVLVIDDNADVRAFVHRHLEPLSLRVLSASGADEAFAILRDRDLPDLILLDGVMPGVDGFELCNLFRQDKLTAKIPIILLATKNGFLPTFKGMMSGFNDMLSKPISPVSLRAMVGKYCPLTEEEESWPELPHEVLR